MILDTLDRLGNYMYVSPLMNKVLEFASSTDLGSLEPGRISLAGDDLFVNVSVQEPKTRPQAPIEAHREYIDIQIPLSGDEEMGFKSADSLPEVSVPYNDKTDVEFYPGLCDTYLNVRKGMFTVFFPGEGHAPAITESRLKKIIIKIRK